MENFYVQAAKYRCPPNNPVCTRPICDLSRAVAFVGIYVDCCWYWRATVGPNTRSLAAAAISLSRSNKFRHSPELTLSKFKRSCWWAPAVLQGIENARFCVVEKNVKDDLSIIRSRRVLGAKNRIYRRLSENRFRRGEKPVTCETQQTVPFRFRLIMKWKCGSVTVHINRAVTGSFSFRFRFGSTPCLDLSQYQFLLIFKI